MVPCLYIDRFQSGIYRGVLEDGGQPIGPERVSSNVADAFRYFGQDVPDDLIQFVEIRYCGYSIGTISTERMKTESEALASDLMALYSAVLNAEEEMQLKRQKAGS